MLINAFLNQKNIASFQCPFCKKAYLKDFAKRNDVGAGSKFKCKCKCGKSFMISLERRKHFRMPTRLPGAYLHERHQYRGGITVLNLSESGAGIELSAPRKMFKGEAITLKFNLDNHEKTFIAKYGTIRKMENIYVGVEFLSKTWDHDPLSGYLKKLAR